MKKLSGAVVASAFLVVLITSTVFALTILVDGTRESAWDSGGSIADDNETDIDDGLDIINFQWTNDQDNFYFLVETAADTEWDRPASPDDPYIWLCINVDNDTSTGTDHAGVCKESGYDRYVRIEGPTPLTITVYDEDKTTLLAATTQVGTSGAITEVSVDLATLGFDSSNCGPAPVGVYFDNRIDNPDDNVADGADVPVTCGSPTAVNLISLDGSRADSSVIALVLFIGVLLVLGAATFLGIIRQRV